ncbi:uncharacterized protein HGUI_01489 [Hanseniaspora guilliermondii]|uniref:Uncharacterized protein n=1 Tax=Hanseniaspora guilliermondii TaxID=56406 RepID=A0A1L0CLJ2_9ASCO|nr:uncharacterized protein HGUI_01489 [Hanseniaspora guilliermondii]
MDIIYCNDEYNIVAKCNYNLVNNIEKISFQKLNKVYNNNGIQSIDYEDYDTNDLNYKLPITNLKFLPQSFYRTDPSNRLLMTSSTTLDVLHFNEDARSLTNVLNLTLLKGNKNDKNALPPITSFDFNLNNCTDVIQSCIDTTCSVYDLSKQKIKSQLIAHDDLVLDVKYLNNNNVKKNAELFMTSGKDGSLRLFDLRVLDHSSILYEDSQKTPLTNIEVNPLDSNKVLCFSTNNQITYIDLRYEKSPIKQYDLHSRITSCLWVDNGLDFLVGDNSSIVTHWNINNLKTNNKPCNFYKDNENNGIYKMKYLKNDNLIYYINGENHVEIVPFTS